MALDNIYKDVTTHSRGSENREPRIFECTDFGVGFRVHRHIDYDGEWLLSCRELGIDMRELHTTNMEIAKAKGLELILKITRERANRYDDISHSINYFMESEGLNNG